MSFEKLGLAPEILRAVKAKRYETPTPIQEQAIPAILNEKDVIGCAQTGTGKTAGFTLPILNKLQKQLLHSRAHLLRVLVLVPTRELAAQVHDSIRAYGRYLRLRTAVVFGGVRSEPQKTALRQGADIVVATPGRLLDHMRQGNVNFKNLEVLVIDEADRMLDMGFIPDIRTILKNVPSRRQTLFFSATMPPEILKLANEILKDPEIIKIVKNGTPASGIRQVVYPVEASRKRELLLHLIQKEKMEQILVFTRTKRRADDLTQRLKREGKRVVALHSDKTQSSRTKALEAFRRKDIQILVATNIAARGLDIKGVSHVVNYEIPDTPEDYVHRIGRTARAECTGDAVSLMSPEEMIHIRGIERLMGKEIQKVTEPGFECNIMFLKTGTKRSFGPRRFGRGRLRRPALSRS